MAASTLSFKLFWLSILTASPDNLRAQNMQFASILTSLTWIIRGTMCYMLKNSFLFLLFLIFSVRNNSKYCKLSEVRIGSGVCNDYYMKDWRCVVMLEAAFFAFFFLLGLLISMGLLISTVTGCSFFILLLIFLLFGFCSYSSSFCLFFYWFYL